MPIITPSINTKDLDGLVKEMAREAELVQELNIKFNECEGEMNQTEFSRCILFFMMGRALGRKEGKKESPRR
jgi:hypothetical protein